MAEVLLRLDQVSKTFALSGGKSLTAVENVSFNVEKGQICILLGPSGSGKSTILRMIAGLETQTSGTTRLRDRQIDGPGQDRGMVFQAYTSFDWMSVGKNVEFGMRINGIGGAERKERAAHFVNLVGLTKFIDTYPSRLSGGMRQRVMVTPDMHRVHHSVIPAETNSNFGFNLPWWDRLLGTYRAQPKAGHTGMTIGIEQFRTPRDLWLDRMLLQPLRGKATGGALDREKSNGD